MTNASPDLRTPPTARLRQREIWLLIAPLALVPILMNVSNAFFSAILARFESATDELAGWNIGIYLLMMLWSPSMHVDQAALVYGRTRRGFRRVIELALLVGGAAMLLALAIGLLPSVRHMVIEVMQRAPDDETARRAGFIVAALAPVPLIQALAGAMRGALIQARRTRLVTLVFTVGRVLSITTALALLPTPFIQARPLALPAIAYLIDSVTRLLLYGVIALKVVWPNLPEDGPEPPSMLTLLKFQYPLMLTSCMMALSRPLINAFIGSMEDGKFGLAALAVVFPLSNLTYGWLNDTRVLPPAFREHADSPRAIRKFSVIASSVVFALTLLLFATPLVHIILGRVMGVGPDLAPQCRSALLVFCFYPFSVVTRGYLQGLAVARFRTGAMTLSGPLRIVSICVALVVLASLGVTGAVLGSVALWSGFITESVVIAFFLRRGAR